MSACQSFKHAVLSECTAAGLTLDETHELVKAAVAGLESGFETEKEAFAGTALGLYLGAPIAAGGLLGYGGAKMHQLFDQDEDPAEIKKRELIEAYRRNARQATLRNRLHERHQQMPPGRPLLR